MAIVLENYNGARKLIATGAPQQEIDDSVIAPDRMWSSKKLIEISTSQFETTGNPVAVSPFAYSPLGVKINFTPKQSGTGDPSPDNIRPISGYDEVAVNVRGKNLLSDENFQSSEKNGITFTKMGNGVVHIEGTSTGTADSIIVNDVPQLPPGKYMGVFSPYLNVVVKKARTGQNYWYSAGNGVTIEPGDVIQYYYLSVASDTTLNEDVYIFLAPGDSPYQASDVEPYQPGTTAALTLPETIYGGTVDAVSGDGSKEWEFVEFDGTENWNITVVTTTTTTVFNTYATAELLPLLGAPKIVQVCNVAAWHPYNWSGNYPWTISGSQYNGNIYISVPNEIASTVEEWKSYLSAQAAAGTHVQVAYKLATPSVFTSDGYKTIQPLEGVNTIYSDTDSVTVSGRTSWINLMEGGN